MNKHNENKIGHVQIRLEWTEELANSVGADKKNAFIKKSTFR